MPEESAIKQYMANVLCEERAAARLMAEEEEMNAAAGGGGGACDNNGGSDAIDNGDDHNDMSDVTNSHMNTES